MAIRPITTADKEWVTQVAKTEWRSTQMISRGNMWDISTLPGFIAEEEGRAVGLLTYQLDGEECELSSLNSLRPGRGIGTALIVSLRAKAKEAGCTRIIVITTNDNTNAIHFYQKRGFVFSAVRINAMDEYRKLKPQIPLTGDDGIPLRDEIELALAI